MIPERIIFVSRGITVYMSTYPENVGQKLLAQTHQILLPRRHTYTTLRHHDVRQDTITLAALQASNMTDRQTEPHKASQSFAEHQVTLFHPHRYDTVFHNAPTDFSSAFLTDIS